MGMEGTTLKACSTDVGHEGTSPLQEAARELQSPEEKSEKLAITKAKRKKQQKTPEIKEMKRLRKSFNEMTESVTKLVGSEKNQNMTPEIKEIKRLRKSFNEMTESVKKLEGTLMTKAGPPLIYFKAKETTLKEKNEEEYKYECCFECKESGVLNSREHTIFVRGFDPSLARDDIKAALKAHFRTCGRVCRVFVPTHCQTGTTLGYAFIDMPGDADKALKLSGSSLGGWSLEVMMAKDRPGEFCGFPTLKGCKRCYVITQERIHQRFTITNGGRCLPTKFKFPYL